MWNSGRHQTLALKCGLHNHVLSSPSVARIATAESADFTCLVSIEDQRGVRIAADLQTQLAGSTRAATAKPYLCLANRRAPGRRASALVLRFTTTTLSLSPFSRQLWDLQPPLATTTMLGHDICQRSHRRSDFRTMTLTTRTTPSRFGGPRASLAPGQRLRFYTLQRRASCTA